MKVVTTYNNFARAKIDHDALGRFDLPIYTSGSDIFRNFESNFKGNAMFRRGWERLLGFQDCAFVEFKFSNSQNYIVVMYATKMRFLSYDSGGNFGWVLDSMSNILEVTTPYTLAESKYIAEGKPAQNADVMIFAHRGYAPKQLKRVAANNFTFTDYVFTDAGGSPFAAKNATITGVTQANPGVVTATAHGLRSGDQVTITGVVGMTQLNGNTYTIDVLTANTFALRATNTTAFTAYGSGGTAARAASYPNCALYYRARLYFSRNTTIWASGSGSYSSFDLPVTNTATTPLQFTIADITQEIEWMFGGDNSLIVGTAEGIVAVNGGNVGDTITAATIEATITSADGCNHAYPLRKDGLIFYVSNNDRNVYYFKYDLLTESFVAQDANLVSYDITLGGLTKLRYKKDRNDLVCFKRNEKDLVTLNFKERESITGWHEHESQGSVRDIAVITNNAGAPQLFGLMEYANGFAIERQAEAVEFAQRANFFSGKENKAIDDRAYNRYVAEQLRDCIYLDDASTYRDLRSTTLTFNPLTFDGDGLPLTGTLTASGASFLVGDVGKHVAYKTKTGYESGRYRIEGYTSATVVNVSVLQTPTANVYADGWYMSFTSLSGLAHYNGTTVGVVTDGGYLEDREISGGATTFTNQITSVVLGYRYKGVIKTFSLGFALQGANTQTTLKSINRVGISTVASAGGEVGADLYSLEPVQELTGNELNYLPPIPIDGTKYIPYSDDSGFDKYFYIVQDQPLPFHVCAAMIEAEYAVRS